MMDSTGCDYVMIGRGAALHFEYGKRTLFNIRAKQLYGKRTLFIREL